MEPGRLSRGGVDRNLDAPRRCIAIVRRLSRGGVDRNAGPQRQYCGKPRRLSRGGVDRNRVKAVIGDSSGEQVASHAEAWIETSFGREPEGDCPRRLSRGGVDRNLAQRIRETWLKVASHAEAWIETPHGERGQRL